MEHSRLHPTSLGRHAHLDGAQKMTGFLGPYLLLLLLYFFVLEVQNSLCPSASHLHRPPSFCHLICINHHPSAHLHLICINQSNGIQNALHLPQARSTAVSVLFPASVDTGMTPVPSGTHTVTTAPGNLPEQPTTVHQTQLGDSEERTSKGRPHSFPLLLLEDNT